MDFAQDMDIFFNTSEFAEEVVYGSQTIHAVVDFLSDLGADGANVSKTILIYIRKSDVSAPKADDFLLVGGTPYSVEFIVKGDDLTWQVQARRDERVRFRS